MKVFVLEIHQTIIHHTTNICLLHPIPKLVPPFASKTASTLGRLPLDFGKWLSAYSAAWALVSSGTCVRWEGLVLSWRPEGVQWVWNSCMLTSCMQTELLKVWYSSKQTMHEYIVSLCHPVSDTSLCSYKLWDVFTEFSYLLNRNKLLFSAHTSLSCVKWEDSWSCLPYSWLTVFLCHNLSVFPFLSPVLSSSFYVF